MIQTGSAEATAVKRKVIFGILNNIVFAGVGGFLVFLQSILVMRLLGPDQIGIWAIAAAFAAMLEFISDFGIGDRLVQQDAPRLEDAFHFAATVHLLAAIPLWVAVVAVAPSVARFYNIPVLQPVIQVMSLAALGGFLRLPLFLLYRDMKFFEQRLLALAGKIAGFAVTVGLAYAHYGVWSLAYGGLASLAATSLPAWYLCPFRMRWNFSWSQMRPLLDFSWPVWLSRVTLIAVQQGAVLVVSVLLSVRDLGQFKSSEQIAAFAVALEIVFAQTLYPALCRLKNSPEELRALFMNASRASMVWFTGVAFVLMLFSHQIIQLILTSKWQGAEIFFKASGAAVLLGASAFNWEVLLRAAGRTQPILHVAIIYAASFGAILCPLMYMFGRQGMAAGLVIINLIAFLARNYGLRNLHLNASILSAAVPSVSAALMASLVLLAYRYWVVAPSTLVACIIELTLFLVLYGAILSRTERTLAADLKKLLWDRRTAAASAL